MQFSGLPVDPFTDSNKQKQLLWAQWLCLLEMTQNGRCKMVPNGRLGLAVKAKDGAT